MTDKTSYREDLAIDFGILEHNWARHPDLYMKWGELHSAAIANRDRKKEEIDLKYSELDKDVRTNPEKYGIVSIKEAAVTAAIKSNEDYKALVQELIDMNHTVNDLACAKTAFEHRKKALEGITQLYCAGFFAKPNIPTKAQEELGGNMKDAQTEGLEADSGRLKKKKPLVKRG